MHCGTKQKAAGKREFSSAGATGALLRYRGPLDIGRTCSRMNPRVHFITVARSRDREGSVSTPGGPRVDSEDRTARPVKQAAVSLRFG